MGSQSSLSATLTPDSSMLTLLSHATTSPSTLSVLSGISSPGKFNVFVEKSLEAKPGKLYLISSSTEHQKISRNKNNKSVKKPKKLLAKLKQLSHSRLTHLLLVKLSQLIGLMITPRLLNSPRPLRIGMLKAPDSNGLTTTQTQTGTSKVPLIGLNKSDIKGTFANIESFLDIGSSFDFEFVFFNLQTRYY